MEHVKYIVPLLIFFFVSITVKSQESRNTLPDKVEILSVERDLSEKEISLANTNANTLIKHKADTLQNPKDVTVSVLLHNNNRALMEASPLRELRLRTNMLGWAVLVPNVGLEWRVEPRFSIQANVGWTHFIWNNKHSHYRLFYVNAEGRYYMGKKQNGYVGAAFNIGQFNFKYKDVGNQGDVIGASLTGGYILQLNQDFDIDFGLGIGYLDVNYKKYTRINERYKQLDGNLKKGYWGPTQLTVALVWKIKQAKR